MVHHKARTRPHPRPRQASWWWTNPLLPNLLISIDIATTRAHYLVLSLLPRWPFGELLRAPGGHGEYARSKLLLVGRCSEENCPSRISLPHGRFHRSAVSNR